MSFQNRRDRVDACSMTGLPMPFDQAATALVGCDEKHVGVEAGEMELRRAELNQLAADRQVADAADHQQLAVTLAGFTRDRDAFLQPAVGKAARYPQLGAEVVGPDCDDINTGKRSDPI